MSRAQLERVLADPLSTHYEVLGIRPGEVEDETVLREARRVLMLAVHPDRAPGDGAAHTLAARVNAAYSVVSDSAARKRYDASLRTTHTPCGPCEGAGYRDHQRGFKKTTRLTCLGCDGSGWIRKAR